MDVALFRERLARGQVSRRQILRTFASVGVVPVVMPLMPNAGHADPDDHPMMFTWGGYDDASFMQAYVEKYDETPRFSLFADEEEAFHKMRAGFEPDLMYPCYSRVKIWYDAGLLAPVEVDRLSNWPDVLAPLKNLPGSDIDGKRYFIPSDFGSSSVIFRADLAPEYKDNHTWGILWDEKYKGRLASFDSVTDTVVIAAIYAGVENPFDLSEADMKTVRTSIAMRIRMTVTPIVTTLIRTTGPHAAPASTKTRTGVTPAATTTSR